MSNLKKIIIGACSVCGIGLIISLICFSILGFDFTKLSAAPKLEPKSYSVAMGDINQISVDAEDMRIEVKPSENDEINVRYSENIYHSYSINSGSSDLQIKYEDNRKWYSSYTNGIFSDVANLNIKIVVEVPAGYKGDLKIKTTDNSIAVYGLENANSLVCKSDDGKLEINNISLKGSLVCKTTNGSIRLSDVVTKNIELVTSDNKVSMDNVIADGDITATTTDGRIELSKINSNNICLNTSDGKISLVEVSSKASILASTTDSPIAINTLSSPDISLSTTSGRISGSILGNIDDYSIISNVKDGTSNLVDKVNFNGKNKLEVKTTDSNIDIEFLK